MVTQLDSGIFYFLKRFKFDWEHDVLGVIVKRLENIPTWKYAFLSLLSKLKICLRIILEGWDLIMFVVLSIIAAGIGKRYRSQELQKIFQDFCNSFFILTMIF